MTQTLAIIGSTAGLLALLSVWLQRALDGLGARIDRLELRLTERSAQIEARLTERSARIETRIDTLVADELRDHATRLARLEANE
jgi:hypothetical protein